MPAAPSLRVALHGASGRMGQALAAALCDMPDMTLAAACVAADDRLAGRPVPGFGAVPYSPEWPTQGVDVVIDFSTPAACAAAADRCAQQGAALVTGTTGLSADEQARVQAAAARVAVVQAANMSVGVTLALKLAELAAAALGEGYDAEILEMHHRHKVDAPSGTALALGRAVARGRGVVLADEAVFARHGSTGPRPGGQIGFATLRGGDVVGQHEVIFAGPGERVTVGHTADSRSVFAHGALRAARFAARSPAGLYGMADVVGLGALGG